MLAFVLSGGGSRGAFEVGALRALISHGIQPDILVGSSAGAVNATGLALDPSLAGVERLERLWKSMDQGDFYRRNALSVAFRLMINRPSLYSNQRFYRLVRSEVLPFAKSFSAIDQVRLYLPSVDLSTGRLNIFGDDPDDSVVDAIMASTAIQPYFTPWKYKGRRYADGGLISNLPLMAAVERGATEIYALDVTQDTANTAWQGGLMPLLKREVLLVIDQMRKQELIQARSMLGDKLHHLHYTGHPELYPFDFSYSAEIMAEGQALASAYLKRRAERHSDPWIKNWFFKTEKAVKCKVGKGFVSQRDSQRGLQAG
jgi:NTE family protein